MFQQKNKMEKEEIKQFREKYGLTQQDLADITGSKLRTVKAWENGQNPISNSASLLIYKYEFEAGRKYALEEKSEVVAEHKTSTYEIPSQMELMMDNKRLHEEISQLKSEIIKLKDELLVKKNLRGVKDA